MSSTLEWPWQYNFPPFFTIQINANTLKQQLSVWRQLVVDYMRINKLCILDVREAQKTPIFRNVVINRQLSEDGILVVMKDLARLGLAEPIDKSQTRWYVFWEPLEQLGESIYKWAVDNAMTGSVCTFYEITQGDLTTSELFAGLDENVLLKALRTLESTKRAEIIVFDDSKGVKFF